MTAKKNMIIATEPSIAIAVLLFMAWGRLNHNDEGGEHKNELDRKQKVIALLIDFRSERLSRHFAFKEIWHPRKSL